MPWSGTFHAIGARILRGHAASIGLDPAFTIHDREDSADLLNLVRHELGLSEKDKRFPLKATCLAIYSRATNAAEPLDVVLRDNFPWCAAWEADLRTLFEAYVDAKQRQHVLDYDDLLLYWAELMRVPELAAAVGAQFDHVLVDEYQDTNALQAAILLGLKPDGHGLTVVGDDAQAIYGFRAARVRNILDFPKLFTPPARVVTLEQNYRSTAPILAASNAVIDLARERFTKDLRTERTGGARPALVTVTDDIAQANCVAETILENREAGMTLKDQAVLFRTASHSAMLEIELNRRNIPFVKFGGLKFIEAAHVKDMLAILRWAENVADRVTGFRVLQMLDGIGPTIAAKALDRMAGRDPFDALATFAPPARATEHWRAPSRADAAADIAADRLAGGVRSRAAVVSAAPRGALCRCRRPRRRSRSAPAHRRRLHVARDLPHRPDARSAQRDQRRGGPAVARRGLSHPLDHPFGQRAGMEVGVRAQRRRRLHSLRSRRRHQLRTSRRSAACSTSP